MKERKFEANLVELLCLKVIHLEVTVVTATHSLKITNLTLSMSLIGENEMKYAKERRANERQ